MIDKQLHQRIEKLSADIYAICLNELRARMAKLEAERGESDDAAYTQMREQEMPATKADVETLREDVRAIRQWIGAFDDRGASLYNLAVETENRTAMLREDVKAYVEALQRIVLTMRTEVCTDVRHLSAQIACLKTMMEAKK